MAKHAHSIQKPVVGDHNLDVPELKCLLTGYKQKSFSAKEVIYHEGDLADFVYVIRTGLVKLLSHLPNGRARIVRLHGHGAWMGLGSVLNLPCEHTAVAIVDVNAYCVPTHKLLAAKAREPQQLFQLIEMWHRHLREADMWISEFSTGAIRPRIARLIIFLSKIEHGKSSGIVRLLTVHEMADILGVTPESVSRILAEFKREGILNKREDDLVNELYQFNCKVLHSLAEN